MAETKRKTNPKVVEVPSMDALGHRQPQNLEMETAVLGALMNEQDAFGQVAEILRPESFYDYKNQLVYEAIRDLAAQQKPVDVITVVEQLDQKGHLDDVGGMQYVASLSDAVISSAHIEYHARIIQQKYLARQLITYSSRIQQSAFNPGTDVDDLILNTTGALLGYLLYRLFVHLTPDWAELFHCQEGKDVLHGLFE